ncbi:Mitogen-activated protein kinase kinase kinase 14 [Triplophysa tibetana]|uniref:Mitogen-activated protein kinase kinase kinase 14 n=1 Tax=Triplophysa tibetana TaxID=1572043 RepID=A0A5A9N8N3_9TELE|nr:Mitogen-activated protein kinase kinase kinase 14 [Triplophysa tibetana]
MQWAGQQVDVGPSICDQTLQQHILRAKASCSSVGVWMSHCLILISLLECQTFIRMCLEKIFVRMPQKPPAPHHCRPMCSGATVLVVKKGYNRDHLERSSASKTKAPVSCALPKSVSFTSTSKNRIATEPPPLREIPHDCSSHTADVIKAGLQKDPNQRVSAKDLMAETAKALKEVGGLRSPARGGTYQKPLARPDEPDSAHSTTPTTSHYTGTNEQWRLERDFYLSSLSLPHSPELQEQLLSCLSSDCMSTREYWDKKDSGRWSDSLGDDLSSGVFSYNSQQDGQSFSRDWLVPTHHPPRCFEGVDVHIRDFNGKCIHIRETPRVNIGHIAKGISDQISEKVFSLQTENGCSVVHEREVSEGSLFLRCVSAPDCSHYHQNGHTPCCKMPWSWRIKDGVLETRD